MPLRGTCCAPDSANVRHHEILESFACCRLRCWLWFFCNFHIKHSDGHGGRHSAQIYSLHARPESAPVQDFGRSRTRFNAFSRCYILGCTCSVVRFHFLCNREYGGVSPMRPNRAVDWPHNGDYRCHQSPMLSAPLRSTHGQR
jgi:hypothetical protein